MAAGGAAVDWLADGSNRARLAAFDHAQSVIFWQMFWQTA
jgi:hypothetical protein